MKRKDDDEGFSFEFYLFLFDRKFQNLQDDSQWLELVVAYVDQVAELVLFPYQVEAKVYPIYHRYHNFALKFFGRLEVVLVVCLYLWVELLQVTEKFYQFVEQAVFQADLEAACVAES